MIEFDNITFIYDNKPLMQHFSCCISSGEKVVLYGPSGHGKSTLLASVAGFVLPDEGSIRINGKVLDNVAIQQIRRITAWLPQEFTLPFETVEELIAAPFRLKINQPSKPTKETILNHFARLGLEPELYEKRSIEISGGQRQRIMLMITALLNKKIVLLDEPTSALDPDSISLIIDYIHAMRDRSDGVARHSLHRGVRPKNIHRRLIMETINIGYGHMALGFLLLIIPTYFLYRYRTGLVKDTLIAALRMTVQLFLIGFYLEYLFLWDKLWINLLWILLMIIIASSTALKRTHLPVRTLFMTVSVAFLVSLLIIDFYFLGLVVRPEKIFTARYFIPISGMILGNMLSANVIALNSFYGSLNRERQLYLYLLGNGASPSEALTPFMREALIKSFNPTIASMAVMGLIALPGTMTGQILGGSSPSVAIKYQIMLMITIFASSLISVLLTLWISRKKTFDKYGMTKF